MPRSKLAIGQIGNVRTQNLGKVKVYGKLEQRWRARGRVKCVDGVTRQVQGNGKTAELAREQLNLNARALAYANGDDEVTGSTTLIALVKLTLRSMSVGDGTNGTVRLQTVELYETTLPVFRGELGDPNIAGLTLLEAERVVGPWLERLSLRSIATAKRCKVVLVKAFDLAKRKRAVPWEANPARDAVLRTKSKGKVKAPTRAEVEKVRELVKAWQTPRKSVDLVGLVEVLAKTGMRPGEALALRWDDFDFTALPHATVMVAGTVVEHKGGKAKGAGLSRQSYPKTRAGFRKLEIPDNLRAFLMDRWAMSESVYVFPNRNGGLLNPHNVNTRWRDARGDELPGFELRHLRRYVATELKRAVGVDEAARQLGHESPQVTEAYYAEADVAGDCTAVLELL